VFHIVLVALTQYLGDWTQIRNVARNKNLTDVGFEHGLRDCVILNPGTQKVSDASMATTVEAILGAVELDGGPEALLQVARRLGLVHQLITVVMSQKLFYSPPLSGRNDMHLT
jgi:dsRNA-specific ribonuclease